MAECSYCEAPAKYTYVDGLRACPGCTHLADDPECLADTVKGQAKRTVELERKIISYELALCEIESLIMLIQQKAATEGCALNGQVAVALANDFAHLREIAITALAGKR